jgi:hypothetical protein
MEESSSNSQPPPGPPRRDKFAALASRTSRGGDAAADGGGEGSAGPAPTEDASAAPRRDKLSALAARTAAATSGPTVGSVAVGGGTGRGNKLAALAAASSGATTTTSSAEAAAELERARLATEAEKRVQLQQKLSQRQELLEMLDHAEQLTCKLLNLAHRTTTALQDVHGAFKQDKVIAELSQSYRATLKELHPLLSTNTEALIHPYQNHAYESKQSMYAARVEMRLALERTQVLKAFADLEPRRQVAAASNSVAPAVRGVAVAEEGTVTNKRKRDDEDRVCQE